MVWNKAQSEGRWCEIKTRWKDACGTEAQAENCLCQNREECLKGKAQNLSLALFSICSGMLKLTHCRDESGDLLRTGEWPFKSSENRYMKSFSFHAYFRLENSLSSLKKFDIQNLFKIMRVFQLFL
jgi:hypothetical protein